MDIDWSEAPEGATHYCPAQAGWIFGNEGDSVDCCCIPRPTTPAWNGEGYPPVGCECEGDPDTRGNGYEPCKVVHIDKDADEREHSHLALFRGIDGRYTEPEWCSDFRPLRTKEQREREELELELARTIDQSPMRPDGFTTMIDIEAAVEAILAKYTLTEK